MLFCSLYFALGSACTIFDNFNLSFGGYENSLIWPTFFDSDAILGFRWVELLEGVFFFWGGD